MQGLNLNKTKNLQTKIKNVIIMGVKIIFKFTDIYNYGFISHALWM